MVPPRVEAGATDFLSPNFGTVSGTGVRSELPRAEPRFLSKSPELSDEFTITRRGVWDVHDDIDPQVVVVYGTHQSTPRWTCLWSRRRRRSVAYILDSENWGGYSRSVCSRLLARAVLESATAFLPSETPTGTFVSAVVPGHRGSVMRHFRLIVTSAEMTEPIETRFAAQPKQNRALKVVAR